MIKFIKKVLVASKAEQAQIRRQTHNQEQLKLIYEGLEARGY